MTGNNNSKTERFWGVPHAYSFNTKEFPDKLRVRYITFTEEFLPMHEQATIDSSFKLLDCSDPRVQEFLTTTRGRYKD